MKKKLSPKVVIVIVNWNGGKKIVDCLSSLKMTLYPNFEVILVDNCSKDNSIKQLKRIIPSMKIIKLKKNYGYTIATNLGWQYGIKKLKADYICAMDSDIVTVERSWLTKVINELEKSEKRGIACCKLIFPDNRLQRLYFERKVTEYQEIDNGAYDFIKEVEGVGGACIVIKKEVIEKIGHYDENFFYGPNDFDYCFRARRAGFICVYVGTTKAIHVGSSSYIASDRTNIFKPQAEGNIIYQIRHFGWSAGVSMVLLQVARIFITKKEPYKKRTLSNLYFHKDIIKRGLYFLSALRYALKNYAQIKKGDLYASTIKK